ncbi:MAG: glycine zipper 2TM domain-containing protein [Usitatibacter sp.]
MNRQTVILALASVATAAATTTASAAESFGDRARVLSSRAVIERIPVAREECWNDRQRSYEERRITRSDTGASLGAGTVLGAVVGGVIGHQFGNSSGGRDRGTAAGAIVGGIVGNQIENSNPPPRERVVELERVPVERNVERCRTIDEVREATIGYDVRYEYAGRTFNTRMDRDPGRFVRVRVDIAAEGADEPPRPGPRPPAYPR